MTQSTETTPPPHIPMDVKALLEDQELREAVEEFYASGGEYKDAVNMTDEQIESVYALAVQFYEANRYDKAAPLCQLICVLDNKQPRYWRALGAARQMQGEMEAAVAAFSMALMLDFKNPSVLIDMGNCLLTSGDLERAREAYNGALTIGADQTDYASIREQAQERIQLIDAVESAAKN